VVRGSPERVATKRDSSALGSDGVNAVDIDHRGCGVHCRHR
jgi:hypothetical protein